MRRRDVLRRLTATTAIAVGGSGIAATGTELYVDWEFPDGRTERIELAAFARRNDTPPVSALGLEAAEPTCCAWADEPCRECGYEFEIE